MNSFKDDASAGPESGPSNDPVGHAPCLSSLPAPVLDTLRRLASPRHVPRGSILLRQGSRDSRLIFVIRGQLKLTRPVEGGRVRTLRILGAGDCWCGAPLNGSIPSAVNVECHADAEVVSLRGEEVASLLADIAGGTAGMVACLGRRLSEFIAEAADAPRLPVRRKMARTLARLASRPESPPGAPITLEGITHEDLASLVGTVREVASRTLGAFERAGWIRTGRGRIVILDPGRLIEVAAEEPSRAAM